MHMNLEQYRDMFGEEISVRAPDGAVQAWSLQVSMNGHGDWRVRLSDSGDGEWEGDGHDVFDAFAVARSEPESRGFRFLVVGARPDCWPSGMRSQMDGGLQVYVHYNSALQRLIHDLADVFSRRGLLRYVFAPAPISKVGTAQEQAAFRKRWKMRIL